MIGFYQLIGFALTVGVLIVVHEYGHFRVARACGIKVLRFSIGFGRVIWRRQPEPGGTEFTVALLPLGGYVRMLDESEGPVAPSLRDQAFNNKPLWQRAAVVAAGPVANFLLAIVLLAGVSWMGVEELRPVLATPPAGSLAEAAGMQAGELVQEASLDGHSWEQVQTLSDLHWHLVGALSQGGKLHLATREPGHGRRVRVLDTEALATREINASVLNKVGISRPYVEVVLGAPGPDGAAARAGLQAGDKVLSIDGRAVADGAAMVAAVRGAVDGDKGRPLLFRIERRGQVLEAEVVPAVATQNGQTFGRIDAPLSGRAERVLVQRGFVDGLANGASRTWELSALTLRMLGRMLIGEASLKNLSGPFTIAEQAGQSVQLGPTQFLAFLALVSVSLGVLNLLPLPMLDGGHLMYYLFEGLSGRPVSEWWHRQLQRAGAFVLLLMMALALSNDMTRLLGLH
ncbi:RIP metalloprotease RseP [Pelomonas sp. SE-A7]|uniref:RIP metalloprotease RseP n=1 Tax=Pelomonas sp. SE-A7 TaxID=3054953 RepID=UPI00259D1240|nr:RIP metalloprotease RseP [Pelomonas sp. SE-A7]MDM4767366.1 RIP metalloprotease RseP [Pelomonas sp. SE-A7]